MLKTYIYSSLVFTCVLATLSAFVLVNQSPLAVADESEQSVVFAFPAGEITAAIVGDAPNVSSIEGKIYFAGQPTAASLLSFREKGIKTIVNLRMESEMQTLDFEESKLVESLGMKYINIPIGSQEPTDETIALIMNTIEENTGEPLLMHCASSNRAGYVWAMYQGTRGGESLEKAIEKGSQAGMKSPALQERAGRYISRHLKTK